MNTVTFGDLFGTVKRRILPILIITVICVGLVLAQGLLSNSAIAKRSYTAEATISVFVGVFEENATSDYTVNDIRAIETARRIVVSDSVAGEVRRSYQDEDPSLTISSPFAYDHETAQRFISYYVFVDATSSDPRIALAAANETAKKAVAKMEETFPTISSVSLYEEAILRASDTGDAAEPGSDALYNPQNIEAGPTATSLADKISTRNLLLALFVGLFGSAFCFCAYEILNRKIRTAHDAEALVGIPVIAQVPLSEDLSGAEAKRELGVIISDAQVLLAKENRKIVAVGSIVDPELSKTLTGALADEMKALGLRVTTISGAESEALTLIGIRQLIGRAEAANDFILVDAGAFASSPDAATATATSDTVLLTTQAHRATNSQIKKAIQQLRIADTPLLGIALIPGKPRPFGKK